MTRLKKGDGIDSKVARLLGSKDWRSRVRGIDQLVNQRRRSQVARESLIRLLSDRSKRVQKAAVGAIKELGFRGKAVVRALLARMNEIDNTYETPCKDAIQSAALLKIGAVSAITRASSQLDGHFDLATFLVQPETSVVLLQAAISNPSQIDEWEIFEWLAATKQHYDLDEVIALLVPALGNPETATLATLAVAAFHHRLPYELGRSKRRELINAQAKALPNLNEIELFTAVETLGKFKAESIAVVPHIVDAISRIPHDRFMGFDVWSVLDDIGGLETVIKAAFTAVPDDVYDIQEALSWKLSKASRRELKSLIPLFLTGLRGADTLHLTIALLSETRELASALTKNQRKALGRSLTSAVKKMNSKEDEWRLFECIGTLRKLEFRSPSVVKHCQTSLKALEEDSEVATELLHYIMEYGEFSSVLEALVEADRNGMSLWWDGLYDWLKERGKEGAARPGVRRVLINALSDRQTVGFGLFLLDVLRLGHNLLGDEGLREIRPTVIEYVNSYGVEWNRSVPWLLMHYGKKAQAALPGLIRSFESADFNMKELIIYAIERIGFSHLERSVQAMEKQPYVFISYLREDSEQIDQIAASLRRRGVKVWLDRNEIKPGERWQRSIRQAIRGGQFFLAVFSSSLDERDQSYMYEELVLAIEELRRRPTSRTWFIPVRISECNIPDRSIGAGETLEDLQYVDLQDDWDAGIKKIAATIRGS